MNPITTLIALVLIEEHGPQSLPLAQPYPTSYLVPKFIFRKLKGPLLQPPQLETEGLVEAAASTLWTWRLAGNDPWISKSAMDPKKKMLRVSDAGIKIVYCSDPILFLMCMARVLRLIFLAARGFIRFRAHHRVTGPSRCDNRKAVRPCIMIEHPSTCVSNPSTQTLCRVSFVLVPYLILVLVHTSL